MRKSNLFIHILLFFQLFLEKTPDPPKIATTIPIIIIIIITMIAIFLVDFF